MSWIKDIFSKFKKSEKVAKKIELTTQIGQSDQKKFDDGLKKSNNIFQTAIEQAVNNESIADNEILFEKIEEMLISMDIGTGVTKKILDAIKSEVIYQKTKNIEAIKKIILDKIIIFYLQDSIIDSNLNIKPNRTNIILVSGVNGVGKTTTIAKLTYLLLQKKLSVSLVAADTYRAGAVEQLDIWANRLNVNIFKPKKIGQDPASVVYEGLQWGFKNKIDVIICDTSGRVQSKINLMNELKKIDRIIKKFSNDDYESLLVLDATTGQSGIIQAKVFIEATKLTGIILTKVDGTSKGGIILAIKDNFNLPVKYVGLGENYEDLQIFDIEKYITSLFKNFVF